MDRKIERYINRQIDIQLGIQIDRQRNSLIYRYIDVYITITHRQIYKVLSRYTYE